MRLFRHPRWQHLDYRVKVATTQENKPPTQGTRQWTFTTPRWRRGSILLPSLNAGVPEPTGGTSSRDWYDSDICYITCNVIMTNVGYISDSEPTKLTLSASYGISEYLREKQPHYNHVWLYKYPKELITSRSTWFLNQQHNFLQQLMQVTFQGVMEPSYCRLPSQLV